MLRKEPESRSSFPPLKMTPGSGGTRVLAQAGYMHLVFHDKRSYFREPSLTTASESSSALETGSVADGTVPKRSKRLQTHKEVEESGSGKSQTCRVWFCQCGSIRDTTPHPMGNRSCLPCQLAEVYCCFSHFWRGYFTTCASVLLGVCLTHHSCLDYVCKKFGPAEIDGIVADFVFSLVTDEDDIDLCFETNE